MKSLSLPLLVICLGLAGFSVWSQLERSRLQDRIDALEHEAAAWTTRVTAERKGYTDQIARLEKKADAGDAPLSADGKSRSESPSPTGDAGAAVMEGMAKMMSDPKMRDMMKAQARMGVDMMYRDLFELLNLPEPKRSQFEKLILEKATAGMEAAFAMMGADKTPAEKKEAAAAVKKIMEESDAKVKELLGAEDLAKVKRFEDSQLERMQLQTFTGNLKAKDLSLDEATETRLMDIMYQERNKFPFASNYVDQQNADLSRFTADNAARFNEEYTTLNDNIARAAAGVLSPEQLEVFTQSQLQHANMIKMQLEMGAKMFGQP